MKEYFWLCYFLANTLMDSTGSIESNSCNSAFSKIPVPIVNFCENNQGVNEVILVMDGYLAESIPTVTSCSCVITTSNATKLFFSHKSFVSKEITTGCGSEISIKNSNGNGIVMDCQVQGSMEIRNDEYLNVVLTKKSKKTNTKYCVYIDQGNENARINATCSNSTDTIRTDITTPASTKYVSQYSTEQISSNTQILTEETSTTKLADTSTSRISATQLSMSTNYTTYTYNTTKENVLNTASDANMIMYYAIGGGGGGVVVVIVVVIIVLLCRRCSSKKSQENEKSDEVEEDELQYNMLYVSSANTDIDTNTVDQPGLSHKPDTEVTYSTVDLEETEISNDNHLNQNYDLPNTKTTILPAKLIAPKCLVSESEDKAFVQKSSVTHVTVPGGGSEYAVVNKQDKNSLTDSVGNTYAVVNKSWK